MKRLPIFLFLLLLHGFSFGQSTQSISAAGGMAIPSPDFHSDYTTGENGPMAAITYQYLFGKSDFGIAVNIRGRKNAQAPHYLSPAPTGTYSEKKGSVNLIAALIGVAYRHHVSKRWFADGRGMIGATSITVGSTHQKQFVPEQVRPGYFDGVFRYDMSKASTTALTTVVALGPGFSFSKKIDVFLNIEYWYTDKPPIETTSLLTSFVSIEDPSYLTRNPSTLDLVIGARFNF